MRYIVQLQNNSGWETDLSWRGSSHETLEEAEKVAEYYAEYQAVRIVELVPVKEYN